MFDTVNVADIANVSINVLIPTVLIVLNEILKKLFEMPSKIAVLVNVLGGVLLYLGLAVPAPTTPREFTFAVIAGLFIGASAGGVYDFGTKAVETKLFTKNLTK